MLVLRRKSGGATNHLPSSGTFWSSKSLAILAIRSIASTPVPKPNRQVTSCMSHVASAKSVALSEPITWSGDDEDTPENIVAITAASYESFKHMQQS